MSQNYFQSSLTFSSVPQALDSATITVGTYRITVLFDNLFRVEFDPNAAFEDRATQTVWFRNVTVPFTSNIDGDVVQVTTNSWTLTLDTTKKGLNGLSMQAINDTFSYTYTKKEKDNLMGTYRTLDMVDGPVDLEPGLVSKSGVTSYDDASSVVFENGEICGSNQDEIDLYLFAYGHDYERCIKEFYQISGKTPRIPKYVFGNWWSRYWNYTETELRQLITDFQVRDIPLSVCIIDMDWHITDVPQELGGGWTGYTWNKDFFPEPEAFMKWLKAQGLRISMNLHPADGIRPFDECYNDVCQTMGIDPKDEQIISFDLTDPKFVEAYFKDVHHPLEQQGVDFWWIDWQQGTKSKMKNLDPLFALNHYHFIDGLNQGHKAYLIFSRWSKLGSHRYPIGFSGDSFSTWESLDFQPYFTATATNVGYGWWSHDIGGHQGGIQNGELYTRWVQYGVFSPVMRLHSTKSFYQRREPWRFDQEVEQTVAHFLRLRHKMIPYIHTFNHIHSQGELPLIRPLYYAWPDDHKAYKYSNQYFFGTELMVRPFTSKASKSLHLAHETVWFKDGDWFHFFSGEHIKHPGEYDFYGCLRDINLFAKAGAVVPFATYFKEGIQDLPKEMDIHLFPGRANTFTLIEDHDNTIYHTVFTVQWDTDEWIVTITPDSKVPLDRIFHLHFRSIATNATISASTAFETEKITDTNTLVVTVDFDMKQSISVTLSADPLICNPYSFEEEIMNSIDLSNLKTEEKNDIGFLNYNNRHESRGWLSWDKSLQDKLDDIDSLNIPKAAKRFLRHTTKRYLKNGE